MQRVSLTVVITGKGWSKAESDYVTIGNRHYPNSSTTLLSKRLTIGLRSTIVSFSRNLKKSTNRHVPGPVPCIIWQITTADQNGRARRSTGYYGKLCASGNGTDSDRSLMMSAADVAIGFDKAASTLSTTAPGRSRILLGHYYSESWVNLRSTTQRRYANEYAYYRSRILQEC